MHIHLALQDWGKVTKTAVIRMKMIMIVMMMMANTRFMTIVDSVLLGWGSRAGDDRLGGGRGRD